MSVHSILCLSVTVVILKETSNSCPLKRTEGQTCLHGDYNHIIFFCMCVCVYGVEDQTQVLIHARQAFYD